MEAVLGIDLGTSFFKFGVVDRQGRLAGLSRVPVPGQGGGPRRELPVPRFRQALAAGVGEACARAGIRPAEIRAVSYASQANSFLLLDEGRRPLTPLILWPDRRVRAVDPAVAALWSRGDYLATAGMSLREAQLAVAKLLWLRRRRPALWKRVHHIMTISDYLTFLLSGEESGDEATASLLGIREAAGRRWWPAALDLLEIPAAWLAALQPPGTSVGRTRGEGAPTLGLGETARFAVGSLDHHAAALGAGLGSLAPVSESTGTVLACLMETERYEPREEYCLGPAGPGGRYFKLAFNDNGASALRWYRDTRSPQLSLEELAVLAARVPPGCGGLRALPCADRYPGLQGFRLAKRRSRRSPPGVSRVAAPPAAGGAAADLRRIGEALGGPAGPSPALPDPLHGYFARAIMESTAASLRDLFRLVGGEGRAARIVATGGGAQSDLWLRIKADLLGVEVLTAGVPEPACYGAALMAAAAAGWFTDAREAAAAWIRPGARHAPDPRRQALYRRWHRERA